MKNIIIIFILSCSINSFGQTHFDYQKDFKLILAKTKDSSSNLGYDKLLARFKANDTSMSKYEVLALMIGFTDLPDYKPYDDIDIEKEIFVLNDNGNYEDAKIEADSFLSAHPLSLRVLKEKSYSLHQLKKADSAVYYMDLVHKITLAMLFSGNGKTPESPIFALGLADGERFIENVGMTVGNKGTGENKAGTYMELVDAITDEGDHKNMFFIIQHARNKVTGGDKPDNNFKKGSKKNKKKENKYKSRNTDAPAVKE